MLGKVLGRVWGLLRPRGSPGVSNGGHDNDAQLSWEPWGGALSGEGPAHELVEEGRGKEEEEEGTENEEESEREDYNETGRRVEGIQNEKEQERRQRMIMIRKRDRRKEGTEHEEE